MKLVPATFIEDAAQAEAWTHAERERAERIRIELSELFKVALLQSDANGWLYAYPRSNSDIPFMGTGRLVPQGRKGMLRALEDLCEEFYARREHDRRERETDKS